MFEKKDKPFVSYPWVIRNDFDNIIAYELNEKELNYLVLSPPQAIIISFMDGSREYQNIEKYVLNIFDELNISKTIFFKSIEIFKKEGLLNINGYKSISLTDNKKLPIPSLINYKWPVERLSIPISALVSFTNNCGTDCLYCYAERKSCEELEFNQWMKIFDQFDNYGIKLVDIGGGDLLARKDAKQILKEMLSRGYKFFLSTKILIDKKFAEFFKENRIGWGENSTELQLSVDSHIGKTVGFLTQREKYHERTLQSLKNLREVNIYPRLKSVITPYNFYDIEGMLDFYSKLGIKKFQFVCYSRSFYHHRDDLFLTDDLKSKLPSIASSIKSKYPELEILIQEESPAIEISKEKIEENWRNRSICTGGRASVLVMPNGDITLCDQIPHSDEYVVGNVLEEDIKEIWNSEKLENILHPPLEKFKDTVCFECVEFEQCHTSKGYCYRESLHSYGTIYDAPPNCPKQEKVGLKLI